MKLTRQRLKEIIREEIKNLQEVSINNYLHKSSDPASGINIMLALERVTGAKTAYYRLEKDSWFRRYMSPGKGYGLMIRQFRVSGGGKDDGNRTHYPVLITYLPNEFDNPDDDNKSNYEKAKGLLILKNDGFNDPKGVERFVNTNVKKYKP